jgi:hypothetical protein
MIETKNTNTELDTEKIIDAIYTHQIQNGGSRADYWSDLNRNLLKQFLKDTDDKTIEAIKKIYNITSEAFFILGWKTCLEMLRELK